METGKTASPGGRRGVFYYLACALLFVSLTGLAGCPEAENIITKERDGNGGDGDGGGGGGY